MDDSLKRSITNLVPAEFFQQLARRQRGLYVESQNQAYDSTLWSEAEAESVLPIVRRAMFEHEVRRAAKATHLESADMRHAGDNCNYVLVRAGQILMTAHHVAGPKQFVRPCISRKQNAGVNRWLDTSFLEVFPEAFPDLAGPDPIYVYILHGVQRIQKVDEDISLPFLHVAVPDAELSGYHQNYSIRELIQAYTETTSSRAVEIPDNVTPIIRKQRKAQ